MAKKQHLTVQRAHELVRAKGLDVDYTLINPLVREERRAAKEVYVSLVYRPGDLGEVDFSRSRLTSMGCGPRRGCSRRGARP